MYHYEHLICKGIKYINAYQTFFFIMLIKMMIYENNFNSCCVPTFLLHDFILSNLALREKKETQRERERDLQHFILIFTEKPSLESD